MAAQNKLDAILEVAEDMVREGGYNNFSHRTIADKVGIKSASVHYYFPTKEALGAAVAKRYAERFLSALGDPDTMRQSGRDPIALYTDAFRTSLRRDKRMCLCGLLGAEVDSLPNDVAGATRSFFEANLTWLKTALAGRGEADAEKRAHQILSVLEGAMLTANVFGDVRIFDDAIEVLRT